MSKSFAKLVSYLFHPLLFPTYGVVFLVLVNPHLFAAYQLKGQLLWGIITFVLTFIFPVVWLVLMKKLELIDSLELDDKKQRIIPYIATATFYLWTFKMFKPTSIPNAFSNQLISLMMLGAAVSVFIGFFINIFRKISLHTIGIGSFIGLTLPMLRIADYDLKFFFIALLLLAGVIGTARLVLEAHTQREVLSGYAAGFIGQFFAFTVLPYFLS